MATTGGEDAMGDLRGVDSPASRLHLPELSAAQIGRAVEHSSVAVMITDVNGRIEYVNQCFSRTTGYPTAEIVGKTPSILKSGHTLAADYRELWSTIRRGDDWRGEFCNRRRDGTLYWSSSTISAVKGRAQSPTSSPSKSISVSASGGANSAKANSGSGRLSKLSSRHLH